jgi:hypothetical protein
MMSLRSSITWRAFTILVIGALVPLPASSRPVPAIDTQWWQELDLVGSAPDNFSYLIAGFSRFSDNDPNPALTGGAAFVTWTHGALGATLGYLHAQVRRPTTGFRLNADLPIAAITGTLTSGPFSFSDRIRIEDLIGVPGDPWRYRNLVSIVASPQGFGRLKALALSDEVFFDLTSGRLTRNRLLAGPVIAIADRVDLSIEYVNERDVGGLPGRIQAAFLDIAVRL